MHAHPQLADAARGKVALAQVFARHGAAFRSVNRLVPVQVRAMRAIQACRTEALGGHIARCDACGRLRYHYHSCRNRHCPQCQTLAKERWLQSRRAELLPVAYFHLVFTLPHEINALAQGNPRTIYALLFASVSATLIEFGENPRWLGGDIAATLVLHTWGQTLSQHLHLHCLIAAGALANDQWIRPRRGFLFPVKALSQVFRGKFLAGLSRAFDAGRLRLEGSTLALSEPERRGEFFARLREKPWVVYAKQPFGGPQQVLDYLGRYTHRVAISNHRLVSVTDTEVRFRYKDYANGNARKVLALQPAEFIRRFLLHVLPSGFMRIRHYGPSRQPREAREARRRACRARSSASGATPAARVARGVLAAGGSPRCPPVPALQSRPHGRNRADLASACAGAAIARLAMSVLQHLLRHPPMRRLCLPKRPHLRLSSPLTLHHASVIVISSTGQPMHLCDDTHAPSQFIDPRTAAHTSYGPLRYKFQNTAP